MDKIELNQLVKEIESGRKEFIVYRHHLTESERDCIARIIRNDISEYETDFYDCADAVLENAYEVMDAGDPTWMFPNNEDDDEE